MPQRTSSDEKPSFSHTLALAAAIFTTSASDVGICINLKRRTGVDVDKPLVKVNTIQCPFNLQGEWSGKTDTCFTYAGHTLILIFVCPAFELNHSINHCLFIVYWTIQNHCEGTCKIPLKKHPFLSSCGVGSSRVLAKGCTSAWWRDTNLAGLPTHLAHSRSRVFSGKCWRKHNSVYHIACHFAPFHIFSDLNEIFLSGSKRTFVTMVPAFEECDKMDVLCLRLTDTALSNTLRPWLLMEHCHFPQMKAP